MFYYIILTGECNRHCKYCGGSFKEDIVPYTLQYSIDDLERFLLQDPDRTITFYGGEPLLNIPAMLEIMDRIPAKYYCIQTNGTLLDQIPVEYLQKFHTMLISIDGRREVTDYYRQINETSMYQTVIDKSKWARKNKFKGDLIARMTVSIRSNIYEEVTHLLMVKDQFDKQLFNHVHWQLDVLWGTEGILWSNTNSLKGIDWSVFDRWAENYNLGISRLAETWVQKMARDGVILGIAPFLKVMDDLLNDRATTIRCGSGRELFSINPHGFITACPIAHEKNFHVGDIWSVSPEEIKDSLLIGDPCTSCDVFKICGGRCLYANKTMFWGEQGFKRVCKTVKHFINVLQGIKPTVESLISKGVISKESFAYPTFNNGCEIIP
ncbi:MAG: TIGR04084 family radical SAM/SPASM domain-containing protein [Candidatus Helarchaeota archaeon]